MFLELIIIVYHDQLTQYIVQECFHKISASELEIVKKMFPDSSSYGYNLVYQPLMYSLIIVLHLNTLNEVIHSEGVSLVFLNLCNFCYGTC